MVEMGVLVNVFLDVIVFFCIYVILTLSLNFEHGYTGIFNLGLFLPVLAGALIMAVLPGRLGMLIYGVKGLDIVSDSSKVNALLKGFLQKDPLTSIGIFIVTLIVTVAVCSLLGYVSESLALKLPEAYLALFMLCLAGSLRVFGMQTMWVAGGPYGVAVVDPFWWLGSLSTYGRTTLIIGFTALTCVIYHMMCRSPLGRLLKSIRENELTAECVGKDVAAIKRKVMAFSFVVLGIGGVLHSLYLGVVVAYGYSMSDFSFWPWLMLVIGGTGNNLGAFVGTFALVIMRMIMINAKPFFSFLPFDMLWLEPIFLALMLMIVLVARPQGILPEKPSRVKAPHSEASE